MYAVFRSGGKQYRASEGAIASAWSVWTRGKATPWSSTRC